MWYGLMSIFLLSSSPSLKLDGKSKERISSWASLDWLLYQVVLLVDDASVLAM